MDIEDPRITRTERLGYPSYDYIQWELDHEDEDYEDEE